MFFIRPSDFNSDNRELQTPKSQPHSGVYLRVYDKGSQVVLTRLIQSSGKFSFAAQDFGQHKICLSSSSSGWFGVPAKLRFELKLDNTKDDIIHEHLASKVQIDHLEEIVKSAIDRLDEVIKQQEYSREKEAGFKDESEEINSRIIFFTVLQTLIILVSGLWQILSLRKFFIARKLI